MNNLRYTFTLQTIQSSSTIVSLRKTKEGIMNCRKLGNANELTRSPLLNDEITNLGSIGELLRYHRRGHMSQIDSESTSGIGLMRRFPKVRLSSPNQ